MLCFLNPFCTSLTLASCKTMKSESVQDKNFVQLCYCHRKSCLAPHFSSFFFLIKNDRAELKNGAEKLTRASIDSYCVSLSNHLSCPNFQQR